MMDFGEIPENEEHIRELRDQLKHSSPLRDALFVYIDREGSGKLAEILESGEHESQKDAEIRGWLLLAKDLEDMARSA